LLPGFNFQFVKNCSLLSILEKGFCLWFLWWLKIWVHAMSFGQWKPIHCFAESNDKICWSNVRGLVGDHHLVVVVVVVVVVVLVVE
jgi:hypothetical protein